MIRLIAIIVVLIVTGVAIQCTTHGYGVNDLKREIDQVSGNCEIVSVYETEHVTTYNQLCIYKNDNSYTIAKKRVVIVGLYRARGDGRVNR